MNKETFLEILPEYQKEAPVNLVKIANRLELGIYSSSMLNPAISGKMIRIKTDESNKFDKGSGWYLLMNRDRPTGAIKESLAYLIAKFIIMDLEGFNLLSDSARFRTKATLNDPMEKEINQLALEILLPNKLLSEEIENGKYIHELPDLFKVDPSTLSAKLGYSVYPIDFWVNARSSR